MKDVGFAFDTEQKEQRFVRGAIGEGQTVFDVGANVGDYSILFSRLVGPAGRVHAFEPTEQTFAKLEERLRNEGCGNVTLTRAAVYREVGEVTFNEFPEEYAVWNSLGRPEMLDPAKQYKEKVPIVRSTVVPAVTIDSYCAANSIGFIDYLKVDVEGAEEDVLRGAQSLLARQAIGTIQFEVSQAMLQGLGRSARPVFDLLAQHGYECHEIAPDGSRGGVVGDSSAYYENYVAVPARKAFADASPLGQIIAPEIKNDPFYRALQRLASAPGVSTILEIGSSSGEGSTEAFVSAVRGLERKPRLFCLEISAPRFEKLKGAYAKDDFVVCTRASSVGAGGFASKEAVEAFHRSGVSRLGQYPLEQVLDWLRADREYLAAGGAPGDGIERIKREHAIERFDLVLIDGSEFTGKAELEPTYGARWIALDDTQTYKNFENYRRLAADPAYELVEENQQVRNGYAIFRKREALLEGGLPVHFFTIVLNGEPFIRYHVEMLRRLPFRWTWHIVEGVAALRHDTGWSLANGGHVPDDFHDAGRSNDGTSAYLDQLAAQFPGQVRVYRKPRGEFWDGKLEMVNAPLPHIAEECLLWQVDADELWTAEQVGAARRMFLDEPGRTAAFFWCWFFVGENLAVSSRGCYSQNPSQEWLRTWRFRPGDRWDRHEPPVLVREGRNLAAVNPFLHAETEAKGLVFQHFAYVLPEQLKFKESYYGYKGALEQWQRLQRESAFPARLRDYFAWVGDETTVAPIAQLGVTPLVRWERASRDARALRVLVDAVFFQMYRTGISRVWKSLLEEWAKTPFGRQVVLLDRAGTAPKVEGIRTVQVLAHDYARLDEDRRMLQAVCDREQASVFVSSYYTTPLATPSVFMGYDMVPEVMGWNLETPMWAEKRRAIEQASAYVTISECTARDLQRIYPTAAQRPVTVALCGVDSAFRPASADEVAAFRAKHGITRPYFLLSGMRHDHKNGQLFFRAFAGLAERANYEIVCTGGVATTLEPEFAALAAPARAQVLRLEDHELRAAYSGALALAYPSLYEGFGLPVLEAMACGCPVITTRRASIPEVAGEAALYVEPDDVAGMRAALARVEEPAVREQLRLAGLERARRFEWKGMAATLAQALVAAAERAPRPALAPAAQPVAPRQQSEWNENRVADVRGAAQRYLASAQDAAAEGKLREARLALARSWLELPPERLQEAYGGALGAAHRVLLDSGVGDTLLAAEEAQLFTAVQAGLAQGLGRGGSLNHLLAGMLYDGPHVLLTSVELGAIPPWFMTDFFAFSLRSPRLFRWPGEVERYREYLRSWLGVLHGNIAGQPGSDFWRQVATLAFDKLNLIPLYFTEGNTRELYELRARIVEQALAGLGYPLEHEFAPRAAGAKRRIGILAAHFRPQTETWATLPVYQHLDRSRDEVILIAVSADGHPLEKYCASFADRFVVLPQDLRERVRAIRALDLDAIWIGTNLTAVTHPVLVLAAHRLARVQMTGGCSPATTGLRHMDVFVSGTLTEPAEGAQEHYTERLEMVRGIAHCFDMSGEPDIGATVRHTRASLGIGEGKPIFVSGANFYKIIPELEAAWLDVLAEVSDAELVLYPFNPNWSGQYPVAPFIGRIGNSARARGINPARIKVLMPLKTRADILALLRNADVYLDSFPHSGMTSLLDPLEVGLPVVARDGNTQRSRMGAATLRTIGLEELVAPDVAAYVRLAARLARDEPFRRACVRKLAGGMAAKPKFLDPQWFGGEIERILDRVLAASLRPSGVAAKAQANASGQAAGAAPAPKA